MKKYGTHRNKVVTLTNPYFNGKTFERKLLIWFVIISKNFVTLQTFRLFVYVLNKRIEKNTCTRVFCNDESRGYLLLEEV